MAKTTTTRARSASSINTWNLCKRRWQYTYGSLGLREPAGDAAEAGTRVHKWLENTAPADRTEPVWKKYNIQQMAELLAPLTPTEGLVREQVLDIELDGVLFTLRMDFQYDPAEGTHGVGDYKTVGKPAGVKSVAKLTDDPQRLLYMRATDADEALWLYGVWSTMKVKPVKLIADKAADRERFKLRVLAPAEEMALVPFDADPLSLPANEASCMLFPPAGCPHYSKCHNLNGDLLTKTACGTGFKEDKMSSLFDLPETATPSAAAEALVEASQAVLDSLCTNVKPADTTVHPGALVAFAEAQREANARASEPQAAMPAPASAALADGKYIRTLYINAIPMQGFESDGYKVEYAQPFIHEAERMVADSQHVHHVGLIDYSKGYVATEVQLIENLRQLCVIRGGEPIDHLVLETTSRLGKECMFSLMAVSRKVVKGVI